MPPQFANCEHGLAGYGTMTHAGGTGEIAHSHSLQTVNLKVWRAVGWRCRSRAVALTTGFVKRRGGRGRKRVYSLQTVNLKVWREGILAGAIGERWRE